MYDRKNLPEITSEQVNGGKTRYRAKIERSERKLRRMQNLDLEGVFPDQEEVFRLYCEKWIATKKADYEEYEEMPEREDWVKFKSPVFIERETSKAFLLRPVGKKVKLMGNGGLSVENWFPKSRSSVEPSDEIVHYTGELYADITGLREGYTAPCGKEVCPEPGVVHLHSYNLGDVTCLKCRQAIKEALQGGIVNLETAILKEKIKWSQEHPEKDIEGYDIEQLEKQLAQQAIIFRRPDNLEDTKRLIGKV